MIHPHIHRRIINVSSSFHIRIFRIFFLRFCSPTTAAALTGGRFAFEESMVSQSPCLGGIIIVRLALSNGTASVVPNGFGAELGQQQTSVPVIIHPRHGNGSFSVGDERTSPRIRHTPHLRVRLHSVHQVLLRRGYEFREHSHCLARHGRSLFLRRGRVSAVVVVVVVGFLSLKNVHRAMVAGASQPIGIEAEGEAGYRRSFHSPAKFSQRDRRRHRRGILLLGAASAGYATVGSSADRHPSGIEQSNHRTPFRRRGQQRSVHAQRQRSQRRFVCVHHGRSSEAV
mmetsp:Transcript_16425/g.26564  ORF Transcript_16425/g.26564 Transcript_16425/m.26564 type:complete len:285 (+) Transcript_16425:416-1270(+)